MAYTFNMKAHNILSEDIQGVYFEKEIVFKKKNLKRTRERLPQN